jgi:phage-related protein
MARVTGVTITHKEILWPFEKIGKFRRPPFSAAAKEECGRLLRELQRGEKLSLPHSRPMPSISKGCHELRVRDEQVNWRIIYYADIDAIVVLNIFNKKSQATPQDAIRVCQQRLKKYQEVRAKADQLKKKK